MRLGETICAALKARVAVSFKPYDRDSFCIIATHAEGRSAERLVDNGFLDEPSEATLNLLVEQLVDAIFQPQ